MQEHTTAVSASPEVEYVRGSDYGGGIGGLLYSVRGTGASFNHYNSRGDVIAKTDGVGALTYEGQYEAFGKRTQEIGTNIDRQTANTKDEDPHGLLNEGARYRCLETGTYITRDPAGFVDGPNVYAYVVQNPWTKFDQEGQFWSAIVTVGFAAFDTYQYATGQISGKEYAANMAINAVALAADAATGGMGGGVAVRTAAVAARAGKAGQAAIKATVAADRAINKTENVISVIENGGAAVEAAKEGRWSDAALAAGNAGLSARGNAGAPGGKSSRVVQQESKAAQLSPGQKGRDGEALATQITGAPKNNQAFDVNGRKRIPDQVQAQDIASQKPVHVTEVKNVKSQSLTRQLRDDVDLVGAGGRVDVMLPPNAKVTAPLQRAFDTPENPLNRVDLKPKK